MINPGGSILWWWSAVDSHYTALLNITVTLLNTDSHDCSLHLHAVSVNTLLLIKLQKMVQFPGRMKPLLSTSVCRQQLWEETRRTDIRRGAPSIIYANIVNRNKLKNHFLCHAFLSNFLPPPRFLSFFPSVILSPSLNTSFSLPQDCALALTAHRVCCVYIPSFSSLTSLSLSLFLCTVVNRSLGHLDHDCLPGSVFVEILQRSIGCLLPKGTKQEEGREERD